MVAERMATLDGPAPQRPPASEARRSHRAPAMPRLGLNTTEWRPAAVVPLCTHSHGTLCISTPQPGQGPRPRGFPESADISILFGSAWLHTVWPKRGQPAWSILKGLAEAPSHQVDFGTARTELLRARSRAPGQLRCCAHLVTRTHLGAPASHLRPKQLWPQLPTGSPQPPQQINER